MADRAGWSEGLGAGVIVAVMIAATRPWGGFGAPDVAFTMVATRHLQDAALGARDWTRSPLAWPFPDSVANVDWVLGQALLELPLRAAGVDPIVAYSVDVTVGMALTALACALASRVLLGRGGHNVVAGLIGGLHPLQLGWTTPYNNLAHHEVVVLAPLALLVGVRRGAVALAAVGGAAVAASFHLGFYIGLHTLLAAGGLAVAAAAARLGPPRAWAAAAAGFSVAALTVVPPALRYAAFATRYAVEVPIEQLERQSWHWSTHPGLAALGLAAVGAAAVATGRVAAPRWLVVGLAAVALVAAALALGPEATRGGLPGPYRALLALPAFGGLSAPARWIGLTFTVVALLAAAGTRALADRAGRRGGWVAVAAVLIVLADRAPTIAMPLTRPYAALAPPSLYAALDEVPSPGALYDEALRRRGTCEHEPSDALRAALYHGRPLVGGKYARRFDALERFNRVAASWPADEARELFAAVGVVAVVEHPPLGPAPADAACATRDGHRVCALTAATPPPRPTTASADGPVIAARYPGGAPARGTWTCGDRSGTFTGAAWDAVAAVFDPAGDATDVFLAVPCDGVLVTDPPGAPRYAAGPPLLPDPGPPGRMARAWGR